MRPVVKSNSVPAEEYTPEEYNRNEEFKYYIEHASHSCSYKSFLGL